MIIKRDVSMCVVAPDDARGHRAAERVGGRNESGIGGMRARHRHGERGHQMRVASVGDADLQNTGAREMKAAARETALGYTLAIEERAVLAYWRTTLAAIESERAGAARSTAQSRA